MPSCSARESRLVLDVAGNGVVTVITAITRLVISNQTSLYNK